ncbi:MAG: efflux RND transporter periplasmic adaptor subunit [Nonlabens sp.]|nr:efflux RND transporter periplasmic adaptor subunit [Nonlabens sp.]
MIRTTYTIILLSLTILITSCGDKTTDSQNEETAQETETSDFITITQAQFDQSDMKLGSLEDKEFPVVVSCTGTIDVPPENRAVVNATMGGYIKTTPLLIGDKVRKGQVLVTIENPEFVTLQQNYMETYEQLAYLKMAYNNQQTMKTENITSQKSYLKAESDYKSTLARHNGLEKQLQLLHISASSVRAGRISSVVSVYAPISGSITSINVTKGTYVSPATAILEIIDNDHIHLELSVFEKDIMKVKKEQRINFKIPEASTASYNAAVHLVGTTIDASRTIKVHGHLEKEENNQFLVGMFVEAGIVVDNAFAKAIPQEAVVQLGEAYYVLILESKQGNDYKFKQIPVTLKENYGGFVALENSNAFNAQTQFLTKGAFNLIGE